MKRYLFGLSLVLLLAGCGPIYDTVYTYEAPEGTSGRHCIHQCQQSKRQCMRWASQDYQQCLSTARQNARFKYDNYVSQERASGRVPSRTLNSFLNTFECTKTKKKDCEEDYRACYELCGGKAIPRRVCIANCD